ncbi:MAG TPA: Trk system potassium transporter TrkA [Clostridiales bacterium]|nr:Trk system potassium transporter TrkA [Clostridiales bacterium]
MKVAIIGAGKLGFKLAESLTGRGIDVLLMDSNQTVIDKINEHLDVLTVKANGLEVQGLKSIDINTYDFVVACTGNDEINTIVCTLAKNLGCKKTIARIRNPEYMEQLDSFKKHLGMDYIVNPDLATANEIVRYLSKRYKFYSGDYAGGEVQLIDFPVLFVKEFIGKKIMDLENLNGLLITAIMRDGETIVPNGMTVLEEDDFLYIIGKSESIDSFVGRYKLNVSDKQVKRVMIMGGGKLGYYIAKQMMSLDLSVRIIEQNEARCHYLSEKLDKRVLVIKGDGTDLTLLEEEDMASMDAFIGATGFDEQNLLMSLMAKQEGVNKIIAKFSRPGYEQLIDKLGIDFAINPVNVTAGQILKIIRGGKIVSVSVLLGGQAEVTEVIVDESMPIVGKKLADLGLSKGIIIGAIVRDKEILVPNGQSVIQAGNRIIIFCLTSDLSKLDVFLKSNAGGRFHELRNRYKGFGKTL